jgi:hypothetical protein
MANFHVWSRNFLGDAEQNRQHLGQVIQHPVVDIKQALIKHRAAGKYTHIAK